MSEKNKNRNDRLSDFLRYKGNKMTERERNAFERSLQKDPFAAEASEGFEGIDPDLAEKDISELRKSLRKRTGKKQRVIWFRIAASVALLMIISAIFIIMDKRKQPDQLAYNQADKQTEEIQIIKDKPLTEKKEPAGLPVEKRAKSKKEVIPDENKELIRVAEVAAPDQALTAEKAMPVKSARTIKTSDTITGFKPDTSDINLSEVVVVGYGARGAGDKAEGDVNEYMPPRPVNGQTDFDKYIRDNIRRPDTITTGQRVVVVLNFKVNATGKTDSIKVIRSPGKIFSDEAIRLIKEGPAWKPAEENGTVISDEVRIRIVFK